MREWRSSNLSQRRSATPKRGFPVAKSRSIQPGTPQLCPEAGPVPDPSLPPSLWVATHLGFTPDPAQARFLDSRDKRLAFVGSRQSGKSETAGAKAFYLGYHHPKTDYLLFGRVARHSTILLQRIRAFARRLGLRTHADPDFPGSLVLPNGSRFFPFPGIPENNRGPAAATVVIIDEAAFAHPGLFAAVTPMVATTHGSIWALSSPQGQTNRFYQLCNTPGNGWTVLRALASECPRISPEFLAAERQLHGEALYAQEYECAFIAAAHQFLDRAIIAQTQQPHKPTGVPCTGFTELYVGIDVGKRQDHTAIVVLECAFTRAEHRDPVTQAYPTTAHLHVRYAESLPLGTDHLGLPARLRSILNAQPGPYRKTHLIIDATGESTLIEVLRRDRAWKCDTFQPAVITGGYQTNPLSGGYTGIPRPDLLTRLRTALGNEKLSLPAATAGVPDLVHELIHFRSDGGQPEHDDLVFALALATWQAFAHHKDNFYPPTGKR
jgi:hypothetical protein